MNFCSFNSCGIGGMVKADGINNLRLKHKINFLAIQETQLANPQYFPVKSLWGRGTFDFKFVNSIGRSGGLLSVWDSSIFSMKGMVENRNFLLISGNVKGVEKDIHIFNIYAPQSSADKKTLWGVLLEECAKVSGICIVMGDCNEVRNKEEHRGISFSAADCFRFNSFIQDANLFELNMGGENLLE